MLAVVGEFSSGKSFLLNALLGRFGFEHGLPPESIAGLLATDINPSTATITELEYAANDEAYAYYEGGRAERIPLDRLSRFVASEEDVPARVLLKIDSPFLHRGFTVADTPGLASINPTHRRATLQFLPGADAVLYLIDTQQPFSEGDASFLDIIRRQLDTIFIVQTKIDLWQHSSENGKLEWESACDRIMQLAAIHAPGTYVYALSARDYVEGVLRNDPAQIERSRFPQFLSALDASLVRNTGRSRLRWARGLLEQAGRDEQERIRGDREMLALAPEELHRLRAQAQPRVAQAEAFVRQEKVRIGQASERLSAAVRERGAALAQDAQRALARAFDAADVARLRDRIRLHILVDGTLGEVVQTFASQVSDAVFDEYDRALEAANAVLTMRFSPAQAAAAAFGASGNGNLWTADPQRALCASIVLDAIGGPAIAIVHAVGARFSATPPGSYMKRELTADLHATIWAAFREEMHAFAGGIAQRIAGVADAYTLALDDALARVRDTVLGSIDRATTVQERFVNPREAADTLARRAQEIQTLLDDVGERVQAFLTHGEEIAAADAGAEAVRRAHVGAQLDREAIGWGCVRSAGALRFWALYAAANPASSTRSPDTACWPTKWRAQSPIPCTFAMASRKRRLRSSRTDRGAKWRSNPRWKRQLAIRCSFSRHGSCRASSFWFTPRLLMRAMPRSKTSVWWRRARRAKFCVCFRGNCPIASSRCTNAWLNLENR